MSDCRKLESMFAPYVDGEAEPQTRAEIEQHLGHCPPCRDRVAIERAAREVLVARRAGLRCSANEHLRRRCAAQRTAAAGPAPAPVPQRRGIIRRAFVPFALAASLLLVVSTLSFFGFNRGVELFAAQLAVDHVKCHWLAGEESHPDPVLLSSEWKKKMGWPVKVPPGTPEHDLQLVGMRQCGSTEGSNAHIMYKWHGHALSLYVMNHQATHATSEEQFVSKAGQETIIWNDGGRTYAVVADAPRRDLEPIVQYVKLTAHSW